MAKKIENRDLFAADFLEPQKKSIRELIDLIKMMESEMKDILKVNQELLKQSGTSNLKDLENRKKAITSINQVSKEMLNLDKEKVKLEAKLKVANSTKIDQNTELKVLLQEQNRTNKEFIRENTKALGAYKNLSARLNRLRNEFKDVALSQGENSKKARELKKEITILDKKLKDVDAAAGQFQRNVGNYPKVFSGAINALRSFGLALGGIAIVRNVFGIVKDFGQAQADLAAISGKTKEELEPLTEQAKQLGATTQFSATQITELQIELAKLGFTAQQIQDSTGAVSNFAAATGADLASAAALAGSALRAFNLDATEMERVVSTLGVATTKSALDFGKLEAGLSTVAPVAASFGFSIEDTTALLGQLSNAGFDASSAATATRNILLNLADANGDLAKELGRPIKSADDLAAGLQELQERGIDLAKSLELTDKRSVAAFQTFIQGSGSLVELRDSITDANQELSDMATKRLDSLQGSLTLLSSAWEGFILGLEEGTGVFGGLKDVIRFVAENLQTIMKVLASGAAAWGVYKAAILATNVVTKAMAIATATTTAVQNLFTKGVKVATVAQKAFNLAVKLSPLGLLITLIAGAVQAFENFNLSANRAKVAQEGFNEGMEKGRELSEKLTSALRERIAEEERLIQNQLTAGEITQEQATKARITNIQAEKKAIEEQIATAEELKKQANETSIAQLDAQQKVIDNQFVLLKASALAALEEKRYQAIQKQGAEINGRYAAVIQSLTKDLEDLRKEEENLTAVKKAELNEQTEAEKKAAEKAEEERKKAAEQRAKERKALLRKLEDLNAEAIKDEEERRIKQTQLQFDREIADLTKHGKLTKEVAAALERKKQTEILRIQKEFIEKRLKAEIQHIKDIAELQTLRSEIQAGQEQSEEIHLKRVIQLKEKIQQIDEGNEETKEKGINQLNTEIDQIERQIEILENLKEQSIGGQATGDFEQTQQETLNKLYEDQDKLLLELNQKQLVRLDYQKELNDLYYGFLSPLETERKKLKRNADIRLDEIGKLKEELQEQIALGIDEIDAQKEYNKLLVEELGIEQQLRDIKKEEDIESLEKQKLDLKSEFNERFLAGEFEVSKKYIEIQEELAAELNRVGGADEKRVKKLEKKKAKIKRQTQDETNARILEAEKELQRELIKKDIAAARVKREGLKESSIEYKQYTDEIQDLEKQLLELNKTTNDEIAENERQKLRERYDAFKAFVTKIVELMDAKTDKQIANIDKELEASKNRQSQLEELANRGNLKAEQSVSAEIKRQAELERQREALEKKKLRRRAFLEGLELLGNKIETGEKDAVTATIRDMTTLLSALATLPGFYEGTNTTIEDALGKPNLNTKKDGYLVRVDGKEKVLNPSMSARTGNMTTEEITRAAEMYRSGALDYGMLIHPQVQNLHAPYQSNEDILRKFDSLEKTLKEKPILSDLKYDELSKALVVTIEANGDLKRTHYKLK